MPSMLRKPRSCAHTPSLCWKNTALSNQCCPAAHNSTSTSKTSTTSWRRISSFTTRCMLQRRKTRTATPTAPTKLLSAPQVTANNRKSSVPGLTAFTSSMKTTMTKWWGSRTMCPSRPTASVISSARTRWVSLTTRTSCDACWCGSSRGLFSTRSYSCWS